MNIVRVAAAVIQRHDGSILMAQRPAGRGWSGWWEFPGGKIEINEAAHDALQRELKEEINISAKDAIPWVERSYSYPDKKVYIYFFKVSEWIGEIKSCENQLLEWQDPSNVSVSPVLPINIFVLKSIALPSIYAITNVEEIGEALFFKRLKNKLEKGLKMILVREKNLPYNNLKKITKSIIEETSQYKAKVIIHEHEKLADETGADGLHCSSKTLKILKNRPKFSICGASCHDLEELNIAQELNMSFAVLSPIKKTKSHPFTELLGWKIFNECVNKLDIPVYALGGLNLNDLTTSWKNGGHGISMQRAIWL